VLFAFVAAAALAGFLASGETNASGRPLYVLCCYLCVPMQYAFIAAGRHDLFTVCLPFVATLVIPLLAIAQGEKRALLERVAERYWGVTIDGGPETAAGPRGDVPDARRDRSLLPALAGDQ
jgi:phosphatidate cytidylyltransferase